MSFFSPKHEVLQAIRVKYDKGRTKNVCNRMIGLYYLLLEKNNFHQRQLTFGGKRITLEKGSIYFTFSFLKDKFGVSRKIIKRDLERLSEFEPFNLRISNHPHSGGVILSWKKAEEVQKPWNSSKKISVNRRSHRGFIGPIPQKHYTPTDTANNSSSGSHRGSHTPMNRGINPPIKSSLKDPKININTPPTLSGVRSEILNNFKKFFPMAKKPTPLQIKELFESLEEQRISDEQCLKQLEIVANDPFMRELVWGFKGLAYLDLRIDDRRTVDAHVRMEFRQNYKRHFMDFDGHVEKAFQTALDYFRFKNKNTTNSIVRPIKLTKAQFCKEYEEEISLLRKYYDRKEKENFSFERKKISEQFWQSLPEYEEVRKFRDAYMLSADEEQGGSLEKSKPFREAFNKARSEFEAKFTHNFHVHPKSNIKKEESNSSEAEISFESGSDSEQGSEVRSEKTRGSETGSESEQGSELEKSTETGSESEQGSEYQPTQEESSARSENSETPNQAESLPPTPIASSSMEQVERKEVNKKPELPKSEILEIIQKSFDQKDLERRLFRRGIKLNFEFNDQYYQDVRRHGERVWEKKYQLRRANNPRLSRSHFERTNKHPFSSYRKKQFQPMCDVSKYFSRSA